MKLRTRAELDTFLLRVTATDTGLTHRDFGPINEVGTYIANCVKAF